MQCKSCNTELPKHAKVCPKCGTKVNDKGPQNLKVLAIAGAVIAFIGGLLPFVQNTESIDKAYSFLSIDMTFFWYLFMLALIATIILCVCKKDKLSIITTVLAGVIFAVAFFVSPFLLRTGRGYDANKNVINVYDKYMLTDLLSDGQHTIGVGTYVVIIGLVIAIVGVFWDIMKYFKKELDVDTKYMTNSINKSVLSMMWYYRWFYVMFLPVLIFILLFNYWPMLGLRYSFMSYKITSPYYVGLDHFHTMFTSDAAFWRAFRNTLYLSIVKLILNTGAAVIISLLLHEMTHILFKKTVQTIIYLPHFLSWVVTASLFRLILAPSSSGMVNSFLAALGMFGGNPSNGIFFLGNESYWVGTYFCINIWKDTGWGTILFLATLSGISPELYEAADIDGANRFNKMRYITLPALANTIITVFILNLAKVMNLFESVFVLYNDAVLNVSNVLQTYIYRQTFGGGRSDYGYTTAVGLFRSVVSGVLVIICNYASKKVRGRGIV
jgi:putative aldouronate transport system permease protein